MTRIAARRFGLSRGKADATYLAKPTVGLLAALPATGTGSMGFYWASDSGEMYQDQTTGAAYTKIASPAATELSYDEIATSISVTSTSFAALPSPGPLSRTVTVGASGLVDIDVTAPLCVLSSSGSTAGVQITEDGTAICRSQATISTANGIANFKFTKRCTTTPGSHAYAIQANVSAGTLTIANTGGGPAVAMKITQR